ncbi:hypothetical protein KY285_035832 [Solanum tuberosum]|nr:hypothetical protein KY285_035832 [Solanum tuberosum]
MQTGKQTNNKSTSIDSMLPIPINPNTSYPNDIVEVEGGMDGGSQEIHSNMQERVSKGGNLTKQQQKLQQKQTETTQNTKEQQGNTTKRGQKNNE